MIATLAIFIPAFLLVAVDGAGVCPLGSIPALGPLKPGGTMGSAGLNIPNVLDGSSMQLTDYCVCNNKVISANSITECIGGGTDPLAGQKVYPNSNHLGPIGGGVTFTSFGVFSWTGAFCWENTFRADGLGNQVRGGGDCVPWGRFGCPAGSYPDQSGLGCICKDHQGTGVHTPRFHNGYKAGCLDAITDDKSGVCPEVTTIPNWWTQNGRTSAATGGQPWTSGPVILGNDQTDMCVECSDVFPATRYYHVTKCRHDGTGETWDESLAAVGKTEHHCPAYNDTACAGYLSVNLASRSNFCSMSNIYHEDDIPGLVRSGDCVQYSRESPNGGCFCGGGRYTIPFQRSCDTRTCSGCSGCCAHYLRGGGPCADSHTSRTGGQVDYTDRHYGPNCRNGQSPDAWAFPNTPNWDACVQNPGCSICTGDCRWRSGSENYGHIPCSSAVWNSHHMGPLPPPPASWLPVYDCPPGTLLNPYGGCQACHSSTDLDLTAQGCSFDCPQYSRKRGGALRHFCWCVEGLYAAGPDANNCAVVPTPSPTPFPTPKPTPTPSPTKPPSPKPTVQPDSPTPTPTTPPPTIAPFPTPPGYTGPVPAGYIFPTPRPGFPTQPHYPTFPPTPADAGGADCTTSSGVLVMADSLFYDETFSCDRRCEDGTLSLCVDAVATSTTKGKKGKGSGRTIGAIVGGIVGGVLLIGGVVLLLRRRRRNAWLADDGSASPRREAKANKKANKKAAKATLSTKAPGGGDGAPPSKAPKGAASQPRSRSTSTSRTAGLRNYGDLPRNEASFAAAPLATNQQSPVPQPWAAGSPGTVPMGTMGGGWGGSMPGNLTEANGTYNPIPGPNGHLVEASGTYNPIPVQPPLGGGGGGGGGSLTEAGGMYAAIPAGSTASTQAFASPQPTSYVTQLAQGIPCGICGASYATQADLTMHMAKRH
jgi:hypothetical protein